MLEFERDERRPFENPCHENPFDYLINNIQLEVVVDYRCIQIESGVTFNCA